MDRKRELKEQYKNTKPDMGIIIIKSDVSNKCYLEATRRIKGAINKSIFTLDLGSHINKELQKDWNKYGKEHFTIKMLDELEYDEENPDKDYKKELEMLLDLWKDKLIKEEAELYK
jgi:hypothetical protein